MQQVGRRPSQQELKKSSPKIQKFTRHAENGLSSAMLDHSLTDSNTSPLEPSPKQRRLLTRMTDLKATMNDGKRLELDEQDMQYVLTALVFYAHYFSQSGSKDIRKAMTRIANRIRKKK